MIRTPWLPDLDPGYALDDVTYNRDIPKNALLVR